MQILAISSQVAWGPVGNSAAVPVMMQAGAQVLAIPTIILSNHPGHGTPAGLPLPAATLANMLEKLEALGALAGLDGILTGYFADPEQVRVVAGFISRHPSALYLCDPVIGDDPHGLYVPQPVAEAIRDELLPLCHITTPNRFEREWLGSIRAREIITTSLPDGDGLLTRLEAEGTSHTHRTRKRARVPHGTGDLLAGLYLAKRLSAAPGVAFEHTMARLDEVIARSADAPGLVLSP